jgi:hypothetical protein
VTDTGRIRITLNLADGLDDDAAERLTYALRRELTELPVDSVEPLREGTTRPNSKSAEAAVVGSLVVALSLTRPLLTQLVQLARAWLQRSGQRSIEIELAGDRLRLEGHSAREAQEVIERFIDRHTET